MTIAERKAREAYDRENPWRQIATITDDIIGMICELRTMYLWHWLMIPVVSTVAYSTGFVVPELWRWITVVASVAVAIVSFH